MAVIEVALRTMLAVVFGVAFISKARSRAAFAEFASSLGGIRWLTGGKRLIASVAIPVLEAAVTVLLIVPSAVPWAFGAGAVLLTGFTVVTASEVAKGHEIRCRCFGASGGQLGPAQVARNLVLLALAIAGLALAPASHGAVGAAGLIIAIGLALLAGVAIIRWDDLASLVSAP
ncbi:MAG TPA: MauE/DoxX family redox-associated membrane protein [Streptosporangiaceae bacterium]|nr:MauE/DoxX family redox-associated membrane protein [Streptosporangiaceae bacterium]